MRKKKILFFALAATMACSLSSCHKTCKCSARDGSVAYFSQDDLDRYGRTCDGMILIDNGLSYAICEWE